MADATMADAAADGAPPAPRPAAKKGTVDYAALEAARRQLDSTANAAKAAAARSAKAAADVEKFKALIAELEKAKNTESKVAEALLVIAAEGN